VTVSHPKKLKTSRTTPQPMMIQSPIVTLDASKDGVDAPPGGGGYPCGG
jgi:hypothetical protein